MSEATPTAPRTKEHARHINEAWAEWRSATEEGGKWRFVVPLDAAKELEHDLTKVLLELDTLTGCRDHWKISFDHERENVIRLRGLLRELHGEACKCPDCALVTRAAYDKWVRENPFMGAMQGADVLPTVLPSVETLKNQGAPHSPFITPEAWALKNREEDDSE